ncbi:MAG: TonB system transport protein ExbD [Campylobacterales bacterium]|nr:TonB system transport protein ExbD [Campylobacterales bacterium]
MRALKRPEGLNVIPLIDVMLVLLAIVLTISTFISQGTIAVTLPEASCEETSTPLTPFEITITQDNRLHVNGTPIAFEALEASLASVLLQTPIVLRSDAQSAFGTFVKVMDILKAKGYTQVRIMVKDHE